MHVALGIVEHNAIIGGEGGGGIIHKDMNLCRDSLVGIALILELLANEDKTLSQLVAELPKWEFIKTKFPFVGNFQELKERITTLFPTATLDTRDGLRFDFPDRSWVQIRASNTEPIIRIFGEGKIRTDIEQKIELIKSSL
jgi:phosphomannomutase